MTRGTPSFLAHDAPVRSVQTARQSGAPLLSLRGVVLALLLSVILTWPMLLVTAPLGYFDTLAYLQTGGKVVDLAADLLLPGAAAPADGTAVAPEDGVAAEGRAGTSSEAREEASTARQLRSFAYSAFLSLGSLVPGGLVAAIVLQTTATLMVLFAFVTVPPPPIAAGLGALGMAAFTTLPWFASYAMPDILAAGLILFYALLVGGIGHVGTRWRIALAAIACFGVVSHYGHVPLAFGLMLATLAACAVRGTLSVAVVALAVLPLIGAVGMHLGASTATLDGPSVAPKRLPILLARSIDDGPAAWHLAEACPEAGYAICDIFPDGVPDDITAFLWSERGISSATAAELDAIRAEEGRILWNAFRAYPVQQTTSLIGNFAKQLVSIGTEEVNPMLPTAEPGGFKTATGLRGDYPSLALFDRITFWGTLAAIGIAAVAWARGSLTTGAGWALGLCVFGLLINALIFGGLSAPVDRYQSRVAWAFPALALIFWLNQRGVAALTQRP